MDTGSAIVLTAIFLASKWSLMAHFMDMEPVTTSVRVTPPPHLILTVHVFYYEAGQPTHMSILVRLWVQARNFYGSLLGIIYLKT